MSPSSLDQLKTKLQSLTYSEITQLWQLERYERLGYGNTKFHVRFSPKEYKGRVGEPRQACGGVAGVDNAGDFESDQAAASGVFGGRFVL